MRRALILIVSIFSFSAIADIQSDLKIALAQMVHMRDFRNDQNFKDCYSENVFTRYIVTHSCTDVFESLYQNILIASKKVDGVILKVKSNEYGTWGSQRILMELQYIMNIINQAIYEGTKLEQVKFLDHELKKESKRIDSIISTLLYMIETEDADGSNNAKIHDMEGNIKEEIKLLDKEIERLKKSIKE
jgi:hypothetical protein